jgi:hypothetical protein
MHWLVRIAERADLNGDRPDVPPETVAQDAWPVVARAYRVADERLSFLVAQYFRLEVCWSPRRSPANTMSIRCTSRIDIY